MRFHDLRHQQARIEADLKRRLGAVLEHGQFILGPEVTTLEATLAEFVGVRHCVAVASGTDALLVALLALGVGPGDEVITPSFNFVAAAEMIRLLGAQPVFADIQRANYNLEPADIESRITAKTRAILPADLFGQCPDYAAIHALAERRHLPVIEDAAQSFGATQAGRRAGSLGTIATTSFYPTKPLGCYGDAGACFTDHDGLAERMRSIRNHGQSGPYVHTRIGLNSRMDTLQAAVLLAKFAIFEPEIELRQHVAARYHAGLGDILTTPSVAAGNTSVWAQYTVEVTQRDRVRAALATAGIPTAVHYPTPLHKQAAYQSSVRLPNTERAAQRVLSLPFNPYLSTDEQDNVIAQLRTLHLKSGTELEASL